MYMKIVTKVEFPMFYLNTITTYRATHEVEIHCHISCTSLNSHKDYLDTYNSDMSICQVLHRQKVGLGHVTLLDFILNIFTGVELLTSEVLCHLWDGGPTVSNQDCVMDVEEFCSPRSSRD